MYKIIALIGEAGSGKDRIMHEVLKRRPDIHEIISCTTRPRREGEVEGVNYYYLTPEDFGDKVLHDEMLEATCFNDWFYGTSYESLRQNDINIGVFNPAGITSLLAHRDVDVSVYYIKASDKTRLIRQLNRETDPDVAEIVRRYKADTMDFSDIDFDYIELKNESAADLKPAVEMILSQLEPRRC